AGAEDRFGDGLPAFIAGMVVREDQEAIVLEDAMALGEDGPKLQGEAGRVRVLHLGRAAGRVTRSTLAKLLPGEKEVGQLGIVDVVEERGISGNDVDAAVGQARLGRVARGEANAALGDLALDRPCGERLSREDGQRSRGAGLASTPGSGWFRINR